MTAKWGRKSVILFYASVRGLLTLKRLIIEINRLVKRAFDVAGRESSSRCGDSSGDENII